MSSPTVFEASLALGDVIVPGDDFVVPEFSLQRLGIAFAITEQLFSDSTPIIGLALTYDFNSYGSIGIGGNFAGKAAHGYGSWGISKKVFEAVIKGIASIFKEIEKIASFVCIKTINKCFITIFGRNIMMRRLIYYFTIFVPVIGLFAQDNTLNNYNYNYNSGFPDIEKYKRDTIPSEFLGRFKGDEDKQNFKKLREFLQEKEDLLDALNNEKRYWFDQTYNIQNYENLKENLLQLLSNKSGEDKILLTTEIKNEINLSRFYTPDITTADLNFNKIVYKKASIIRSIVNSLKTTIENYNAQTKISSRLDKNIGSVKEDIYECRKQIDSALAPEYKQQEFRKSISLYFTCLIGLLLVIFFFSVYKKSDMTLSKELLSDNGLQFVTLFVLIIAICTFWNSQYNPR